MNLWEKESYKKAVEKYKTVGSLGMTAADHIAMGSTPADELEANPGKTHAELMSDEELLGYLREQKRKIEECLSEKYRENSFAKSILETLKRNLKSSVEYLRTISRLPEEFNNFDIG